MELHFCWLTTALLAPLCGAIWVARIHNTERSRRATLWFCGASLISCLAAWIDFNLGQADRGFDRWSWSQALFGRQWLEIDRFSSPLIVLVSGQFLLTIFATLRTKLRRFSFSRALVLLTVSLATMCTRQPWLLIALLAVSTLAPLSELRRHGGQARLFVGHMAASLILLAMGWGLVARDLETGTPSAPAVAIMTLGVLIRLGVAPFHCWMTHLYEQATLGTALLFTMPMTGVYAFMRLVLPNSPEWALKLVAVLCLATAVYAAGMALVQREARRFFCYLFLSHSALILVGIDTISPVGLTGALCVWFSVGLALTGFGLTLRSVEARMGRISLADFHGIGQQTPVLAVLFLLTGLASVGFPGTLGFVGTELLVDGAVQLAPQVGILVILAAAFNGIAVLQTYSRIFLGARRSDSLALQIRPRERLAVIALAMIILGGGLIPQPGIGSRYRAAQELLRYRAKQFDDFDKSVLANSSTWRGGH